MSIKGQSSDNKELQCLLAPEIITGQDIVTVVGSSFSTLLPAGIYRVTTDTNVRIGTNTDGLTAPAATDTVFKTGAVEYFEFKPGRYLAVLATVAGGVVNLVRLP